MIVIGSNENETIDRQKRKAQNWITNGPKLFFFCTQKNGGYRRRCFSTYHLNYLLEIKTKIDVLKTSVKLCYMANIRFVHDA